MKHFIALTLSIIIVYLYVYAPPFRVLPFGMDKPIWVCAIFYIIYTKSWNGLYKYFNKEFVILFIIVSFSFFSYLIHRKDYTIFLYDLLLLLECIPVSWALYYGLKQIGIYDLDKIILVCAIIGGIISCYLLLNPEYTYYTKNILLRYPEDLVDKFIYRGYGISDGLLFSYPVIQGFCIGFILINVGGSNWVLKLSMIFLFVSVFANARSGFVPAAIGLTLLLLKPRILLKQGMLFFLFIFLFAGTIGVFVENNEMLRTSLEWSKSTIDIFSDFLLGENTENVDALLGDMVKWPSSFIEWILGSGENLFNVRGRNTDVGYFIRLNYGGIIYMLSWMVLWIYMFRRLFPINKGIALLIFLSLIYLNYKGDYFVVNPGSRFFFLIYSLIIIDHSLFNNPLKSKLI